MGRALDSCPRSCGEWENHRAFVREPWREPPKVTIEDREAATETHERVYMEIPTPLLIYTDGSGGLERRIGAEV